MNNKGNIKLRFFVIIISCVLLRFISAAQNQYTLFPEHSYEEDYFGYDFALINDSILVIGQYGDTTNGPNSGSIHLFKFDGTNWSFRQRVFPPHGAAGIKFGQSICHDGLNICVSTEPEDSLTVPGSLYIYQLDSDTLKFSQAILGSQIDSGWAHFLLRFYYRPTKL